MSSNVWDFSRNRRRIPRTVCPYRAVAKPILTPIVWLWLLAVPSIAVMNVVVTSGTASPDGNGALSLLSGPSINAAGDLAFVSQLSGTAGGTADDQAVYRLSSVGLSVIAREAQIINGKSVIFLFAPSLTGSGVVSGVPALGPSPTSFTHYFGSGGPLTLMYTPGSSSPSGNNTLLGVTTAAINDGGAAAYVAAYSGGNPEIGIYARASDGTVTTQLLRNRPAPRGGTITNIASRLTLNESGQVANIIDIDGTALKSVVRVTGNLAQELARQGDLAVDGITTIGALSSTSSFTTTPIPIINNAGQVAFPAQYTQPALRLGVFVADDSGARLVARGIWLRAVPRA